MTLAGQEAMMDNNIGMMDESYNSIHRMYVYHNTCCLYATSFAQNK